MNQIEKKIMIFSSNFEMMHRTFCHDITTINFLHRRKLFWLSENVRQNFGSLTKLYPLPFRIDYGNHDAVFVVKLLWNPACCMWWSCKKCCLIVVVCWNYLDRYFAVFSPPSVTLSGSVCRTSKRDKSCKNFFDIIC